MSKKTNGVNYSRELRVVNRRKKVIGRLENELKTIKDLSEESVERINNELKILKSRI